MGALGQPPPSTSAEWTPRPRAGGRREVDGFLTSTSSRVRKGVGAPCGCCARAKVGGTDTGLSGPGEQYEEDLGAGYVGRGSWHQDRIRLRPPEPRSERREGEVEAWLRRVQSYRTVGLVGRNGDP